MLALLLLLMPALAVDPDESAVRQASPAEATAASPPLRELVIYPGFEKHELEMSVSRTLDAARSCLLRGRLQDEVQVQPTSVPFVSATRVYGQDITLERRSATVDCLAAPLRRCEAIFVRDPAFDELAYASIQCTGSYDDAYTFFLVTASLDLDKARRERRRDRAVASASVTFQTDEFPGTQLSSFTALRRRDGQLVAPPRILRFDDYDAIDEVGTAPIEPERLFGLARDVVAAACRLTGATCPESAG